jgi:hypothetical protein
MSAEKVINTLLKADATVTGFVADRIYPEQLPQNCALPAIVIEAVSSTDAPVLDARAGDLVKARIQVTVLAADYATKKQIMRAVWQALRYQRGTVDGVSVTSITRSLEGPDQRDDDRGVTLQSVDWLVTFYDPAT